MLNVTFTSLPIWSYHKGHNFKPVLKDNHNELFCNVDDVSQVYMPIWQRQLFSAGDMQRQRQRSLSTSAIMTILIHFRQSHYRDFKVYYND